MKTTVLTLSLAFLCGSIIYCHACSCMFQHPQSHYCNSDFVILARVKKVQRVPSTYSNIYKVRIRKEFKISEKGLVALKSGRLHTSMYDSMCGAYLEVGKIYVIAGRINSLRGYISLCDMIMEWNDVTKRQRKGLKLLYKHGCSCNIRDCRYNPKCYRQKDSCNWKSQCETTDGICLRQASGFCMWNKNKMLSSCKFNMTRQNFDRRDPIMPIPLIP